MIIKLGLLGVLIVALLSAILVEQRAIWAQEHAILIEEQRRNGLLEKPKTEPPVFWGGDADLFKNYSQ